MMKRMIKSIAKAMWNALRPIRRPLTRKVHLFVNDHQRSAIDEIDERVARHLRTVLERLGPIEARSLLAESVVQDLDLALDGMVRELTRLQIQIELLQQRIEEQSAEATVLRIGTVDESDDGAPYAAGNGARPPVVGPDNHWNRKSG